MTVLTERKKVRFISGDTECAAWHYPGTNGACVIMAGGGAVTKEPGTDLFARRFHKAGFAVLAFDYRRLGESGGQPRQVIRIREQLTDWQAAIAFAAGLPGVDPARLAIWGFSLSGGHVFRVAADNPQLAAAIAQTPNADGPAATRNAARHQKPLAMLRLAGRSTLDALGGLVGRPSLLIPLAGQPGTVAMLTTPDSSDGDRALNPGNSYPDWQQAVAARSAPQIGLYQPGRDASRVRCPLLVLVCDAADLSLPGIARLVTEFLDRLDLHDVTLVGNDTGGALVQLLMGDHTTRVGRVVLVSCDAFDNFPPGLTGKTIVLAGKLSPRAFGLFMQQMRIRAARRLPIAFGWLTIRGDAATRRWMTPALTQPAVRRDAVRVLRAIGADTRLLHKAAGSLPGFSHPALVVWASEDRVMPPEHGRRLAALLPHGQLVEIDDSYTLIPLDQPARLAQVIRKFTSEPA